MEKTVKSARKEVDYTTRPLLKKLILFSLPLILTSVLQLLYSAVDLVAVGKWSGENSMAAVGSTGALINLITNLFLGLSVGALAVVARFVGARDERKVREGVHTAVLVSLICGFAVGAIGFGLSGVMLRLMDTPGVLLPLSSLYLRIYFCGMPFNLLYNFGSSVLRACGDTKRPLFILTAAGVVNVALDLFAVAVLDMGVSGVGIATVAAQAVSAIGVVIVLMRRRDAARLVFRKLRIHKAVLRDMIKIGLPAGIQGTVFSLSNVIIQSSINGFGEIAVSGNSAAVSIEGFVYVAMNSVSQACLTVAGQNYGARKPENIDLAVLQCMMAVTVTGLALGTAIYLLAEPLLGLYGCEGVAVAYGKERLKIILLSYFICGLMDVAVSALRAIGSSLMPMIVSIVGICGFRIFWIYTVFRARHTLFTLYISYTISWIITFAVLAVCFLRRRKREYALLRLCRTVAEIQVGEAVAARVPTEEAPVGATVQELLTEETPESEKIRLSEEIEQTSTDTINTEIEDDGKE